MTIINFQTNNFLIAGGGEAGRKNGQTLAYSGRNYMCINNHYQVKNGWMNNYGFPCQTHGNDYMRSLSLNNPNIPTQWFVIFSFSLLLEFVGLNLFLSNTKNACCMT